jgi:hypothetical protein
MSDLPNRRRIGPVARLGRRRREILRNLSSSNALERFVLISFGGIPGRRGFVLPRIAGMRWFVPTITSRAASTSPRHSASGLPFIDLLASCDVLVTKPGYGMFVEAACNG